MSLIVELIFNITVGFLGAFIRWLVFRRKESFKDYLDQDEGPFNGLVGFLALLTIGVIIYLVK
jgi:hypothetical protein